MSIFDETFQEVTEAGKEFDETIKKVDLLCNYYESDFKIMTESAWLERDRGNLTEEEALNAFVEASKATTDKMEKSAKVIEKSSKGYFNKTKESVSKLRGGDKYQSTLAKARKVCEANPTVGKNKIEYKDYASETAAIAKGITSMSKMIAKGKAKKGLSEADGERVKEIVTDVNKERQKADPKTTEITVSQAIEALDKLSQLIISNAEEKSESKSDFDFSGWDPEATRRFVEAISAKEKLNKELSAVNTRAAVSLKHALKQGIKRMKGTKEEKPMEESVVEEPAMSMMDADAIMDEIVEQLAMESAVEDAQEEVVEQTGEPAEDVVEESASDSEEEPTSTTETYMKNLESEVFEESADYAQEEAEVIEEDALGDTEFNINQALYEAALAAGISEEEMADFDIEVPTQESAFDPAAALDDIVNEVTESTDESVDSLLENFDQLF